MYSGEVDNIYNVYIMIFILAIKYIVNGKEVVADLGSDNRFLLQVDGDGI